MAKIKLKAALDGQPGDDLKAVVYAFDGTGNLLASSPLEGGKASLDLDAGAARRARVFIAPAPPDDLRAEREPTLEAMQRLRAYEPVWRFDPDAQVQELAAIPVANWTWWRWCLCRVRGRVVRPVDIGGTIQNLPVCHARVHICEVDRLPWIIAQLPEREIFRLRDELVEVLERPPIPRPSGPQPDPPPFVLDALPADPSPANLARRAQPIASRPVAALDLGGGDRLAFNPQPEPPRAREAQLRRGAIELEPRLRAALASQAAPVVRQTLIDQFQLITPFLCLWPWFLLRCDELRVVETDGQGCFDSFIFYPCSGDKPDLYFWVEACVGGSWTTIYRPPIACNTHWNYACGSEVTLRTTDPRAPVCQEPDDLPGLQVAVMSIGNGVSISEIQGAAAGTAHGLTTDDRPFGGRLEPHVVFSRTALAAKNITHYRWSYRRRTNAAGAAVADSWHAMDRSVIRHYGVIDPVPPDFPLSFHPYLLGPDPAHAGASLFQIQGDAPAGSIGWTPLDAREDSASAFFLTHLLEGGDPAAAAGRYELKLELFKGDGSRANLTDEGVLLKEADQPAPFGAGTVTTIPARAEHRLLEGGKLVGFRLMIQVDNNPCVAEIFATGGSGLVIDEDCGFIEYQPGASVALGFRARHANNHARFRFAVHRGPSIEVAAASAPVQIPALPGIETASVGAGSVNGFVRDATSTFEKTVSVATLLSAGCDAAAFAETLHVSALATDGWSQLAHLDASGTPKAFALAPQ